MNIIYRLLSLSVFFVFLISCGTNRPSSHPKLITPTDTIKLSVDASLTPKPTLALSPTDTSTPTLHPTLSLDEAKALLLSLSHDNGNCQLPCLWGYIPGVSNINDLRDMLSQFGQIDVSNNFYSEFDWYDDVGGISFGFWESEKEVIGEFGRTGSADIENLTLHVVGPRIESLDDFSPLLERYKYYLLPQILSNYGEPTEVIVGPYPFDPDRPNDWLPMNIGLFYPDQGFFIEYILTKRTNGEYFITCPVQVAELSLAVWNPTESKTLLDIAKLHVSYWGINENILDEYYRPIEKALAITPKEFYEKYKDPSYKDCIRAPMSLWSYR